MARKPGERSSDGSFNVDPVTDDRPLHPTLEHSIPDDISQFARRLGFDYCRIVPVSHAPHASFFQRWIAEGRAGEMTYLEQNMDKRISPALLTEPGSDEYRSMIVLGVNYHQTAIPAEIVQDPSRGIIASYAWSDDYHEVIRPLLYELDEYIRSRTDRTTLGKCLVDTGPVLERDWAELAGLGFTGKNCCTIVPGQGSWLFLATVMTPDILYDKSTPVRSSPPIEHSETNSSPAVVGACGRCTRCLVACPTDAFVNAYDLDPRRCISYWTIEAKGSIPAELRPHFANRIFGCDICQEVCPYNRRLPARTPLMDGLIAHSRNRAVPLLEGFQAANPYWLDDAAFRKRFRKSPILRPKRRGMLRNVCVALGNWGSEEAGYALLLALQDREPIVRGHAAWGLGRVAAVHGASLFMQALAAAGVTETDSWVRSEIAAALRHAGV